LVTVDVNRLVHDWPFLGSVDESCSKMPPKSKAAKSNPAKPAPTTSTASAKLLPSSSTNDAVKLEPSEGNGFVPQEWESEKQLVWGLWKLQEMETKVKPGVDHHIHCSVVCLRLTRVSRSISYAHYCRIVCWPRYYRLSTSAPQHPEDHYPQVPRFYRNN
jgi:hypothetical protein